MFTLGTLAWLGNLPWQAIPHARFYPSEIFRNSALSSSMPSESGDGDLKGGRMGKERRTARSLILLAAAEFRVDDWSCAAPGPNG